MRLKITVVNSSKERGAGKVDIALETLLVAEEVIWLPLKD